MSSWVSCSNRRRIAATDRKLLECSTRAWFLVEVSGTVSAHGSTKAEIDLVISDLDPSTINLVGHGWGRCLPVARKSTKQPHA